MLSRRRTFFLVVIATRNEFTNKTKLASRERETKQNRFYYYQENARPHRKTRWIDRPNRANLNLIERTSIIMTLASF